MKLIGSTTSPYVRKVRVVLAEKKLDYQFVEENPWEVELSPGTGNPLGKVPRLVMEGTGPCSTRASSWNTWTPSRPWAS